MLDEGAPRDPIEIEEKQWRDFAGGVGWDIGANMGQSVEKMLSDPKVRKVIAFEPAEESYEVLAGKYRDNPVVVLRHEAVANHDGVLTLSVRQAPIMTGQLVAAGMPYGNELPAEHVMARWGPELATRSLPCITVDTLVEELGPPDFAKVDTEGHELQVLTGGLHLLQRCQTRWLIEFHREDLYHGCANLFEIFGYNVETLRHPHYRRNSHMWYNHGWIRAFPQ
jgi:FkbM family methyltransferase